MSELFWLSDQQFRRLQPFLPTDTRGVARVDDRRVISGIVHVQKTGGPSRRRVACLPGSGWVDAPAIYRPKKTLYNRFVRWAERGIWEDIFSALAGAEDAPDRLFIDSTCIKVHRTAGGAKGGPWPMVSARHAEVVIPNSTPSVT